MADTKPPSLYAQFDARSRANHPLILVDVACANVVTSIGALLSLGVTPGEVADFCEQAIATSSALMAHVDPTKTPAENFQRVMQAATDSKGNGQ